MFKNLALDLGGGCKRLEIGSILGLCGQSKSCEVYLRIEGKCWTIWEKFGKCWKMLIWYMGGAYLSVINLCKEEKYPTLPPG